MDISARQFLIQSLTRRETTERVASAILALNIVEDGKAKTALSSIATPDSYLQPVNTGWGMNTDFERVPEISLEDFAEHFPNVDLSKVQVSSPSSVNYIDNLRKIIRDALNGLGITDTDSAYVAYGNRFNYRWGMVASSRNQFVKMLRFLNRFERKVDRAAENIRLRDAQQQSKSRLANRINGDLLDDGTLSYVAYLAARANRRSLFMFGTQSKAFDTLSDELFKLIPEDGAWEQVALVRPTRSIFNRLSSVQVAELMGLFHKEMVSHSERLGELYNALPSRMREEMVMVQGVDSSRWNAYAGALNTMRSAWVAATISAGMEEVFDSYMPGKAPRLMAADLAWGYRNQGSGLHPDTALFNALPYPWEVVQGQATLTRAQIIEKAEELKVTDYEKSGWVAPRSSIELELPSIEPYTVHGVIVADPHLGATLKRLGVFSGKGIKWEELENEDVDFTRISVPTPRGGTTPAVI